MIKALILSTMFSTLSIGAASASSSDAWEALFAKVNGTCIGQSGLDTPEATAPVTFDDSVGKIAVLLRGETGTGKSRSKVQMICIYDKKSGRASIAEYRWLGK